MDPSLYLPVKTLHVVSSVLLAGTGFGSAYFYFANRRAPVEARAVVARLVMRADAWFTTPAVVVQPLTGVALARMAGWPLGTSWLAASIALYLVAGACWLPVLWLQRRMALEAEAAARDRRPLSPRYDRDRRRWEALGWPAFAAMLAVFALMVNKPALWGVVMTRAVRTRAWLPAPAASLWEALCFYEAVTGPVPALLRWGLPVPHRVVGDPRRLHAVTRCEYVGGEHLVKRSTRVDDGRCLEFEVLSCSAGLSRHLLVRGGTITIEPATPDTGGSWVSMETRYESRGALFALRRPVAEAIIRALHQRVRDEMRASATSAMPGTVVNRARA